MDAINVCCDWGETDKQCCCKSLWHFFNPIVLRSASFCFCEMSLRHYTQCQCLHWFFHLIMIAKKFKTAYKIILCCHFHNFQEIERKESHKFPTDIKFRSPCVQTHSRDYIVISIDSRQFSSPFSPEKIAYMHNAALAVIANKFFLLHIISAWQKWLMISLTLSHHHH